LSLYAYLLPIILLHTAFSGYRVLAPLFAIHLQASPFTVGIIMSLLGLLPMLFSISAGRWIDRIGVRRPMLAGTISVIAGLALALAMPRMEILFLVTPLVGSGFVLFHIAVSHAAGVFSTAENRTKNFSLIALTFSTSGFLGPLIAGFAIDGIGYRATFLLFVISASITLILLLVRKLDTPRRAPASNRGKPHHFTDLLREPGTRAVLIISSSIAIAWDMFSFVVPIHGTRIGLSASQIGLILGSFGIAIFVVRMILPLVAHRLNEWRILIAAMFSTGLTFFVFPLVHTVPILMLLGFVLGTGLGATQPMVMSLLFARAPPGRGAEAVGLRSLLLNASQTGMPLLFGALGAAMGMLPVFWTTALALAGTGYLLRRPHAP
jgi:predicted MFS family arabinose efflux permease